MPTTNTGVSCDNCRVGYRFGERRPLDFIINRFGTLCVKCAPPKEKRNRKGRK